MRPYILTLFACFLLLTPLAAGQTVQTVAESPGILDYLALDRATGELYSTNYTSVNRVKQDGSVELIADGYSFVTGMGVAANGDLYFLDAAAMTIYKRDDAGTIAAFATGLNRLVGIWMSRDNTGLYTQSADGIIYFINFDGTVNELMTGFAEGMTDIVRDEAGNFYVAYFEAGDINKIAPDGTVTPLVNLDSWVGYITYAQGYVYATAWQKHQVVRVDVNTGETVVVAGTGEAGTVDGSPGTAQFNEPNGIVASVTGDTLYVSEYGSSTLRLITSVTSVSTEEDETPTSFSLEQNYPNPFNPSTTITYSLQQSSNVTLVVSDLLGRTLETLVAQKQAAGKYEVSWDATGQPSGVYFYRLETEHGIEIRQMTLLR